LGKEYAFMKTTISALEAHRIWDSRGRPTIEVEVRLEGGVTGRGIAPAGASRGRHEAIDLRDGGIAFGGFGVARAIANVNDVIARVLVGCDAADQAHVDASLSSLDGTPTKAALGGNATIATSMAVLDAAARHTGLPLWKYLSGGRPGRLPLPEIQIFGGGAHADGRIDIQDLLVMPVDAQSFDESMTMVAEVYRAAGDLMQSSGRRFGVADEGGWWPDFATNEDAIQMLARAIDEAGFKNGEVMISLDLAASEFCVNGRYAPRLAERDYDTAEWIDIVLGWVARYPILSLEDPVAEDDDDGMRRITAALGARVQIVGDDYLVTNAERVARAAASGACNAVLLKPNQAGTITDTIAAMTAARRAGWGTVVSARSGETEDTMISHLAVGWDAGQLKVGSFARSERMAKWNECLRIERELGASADFAGRRALPMGQQARPLEDRPVAGVGTGHAAI
jgi:enolase